MRRIVLGSGRNGRVLASPVLSSCCSLSFKPTLLREHVHGICDNVLGYLLFLASCHCSSEDIIGEEPRSAVVLPPWCCRWATWGHRHRRHFIGCGGNPPTLGFKLNRIEFVAGLQVLNSAGHLSLQVGWCVPSGAVCHRLGLVSQTVATA